MAAPQQAREIITLPDGEGAGDGKVTAPEPAVSAPPAAGPEPAFVDPTAAFPFEWPDADAPKINWQLRSVDQRRPEALRPLEEDVRRVWYRSFERAAVICGRPRYRVPLYVNGYEYVGEVANPRSEDDQALCREAMESVGAALAERGESYRHAVQFPPIDAGNARLAAADLEALSPDALAAHVDEALKWYEYLWTEHWTSPQDTPGRRFAQFYKEHFGSPTASEANPAAAKSEQQLEDEARGLLAYEPNLLTAAVGGLISLANTVQAHPALRELVLSHPAEAVLHALSETPGGEALRAELDELLETQGLRSGAGFGTERSQLLPGWIEQPSLVVALVQKYVPQDLDALLQAREVALAERDRQVATLRRRLPDDETRARFDWLLAAARKQQAGFEDHNLKIDSASSALLHRAIAAAARRLAVAGAVGTVGDVWWLRADEIALALRGLSGSSVEGESSDGSDASATPHWQALVAARKVDHAWCAQLTPPPSLGNLGAAPPPEPGFGPAGRGPVPAEQGQAPAAELPRNVLVTGQAGSRGIGTGRVRLVSHDDLVPDVQEGDVLVSRNAGPLWTPVFPAVAAVVLDQGVLFQHAMLTCREYGVPAVFQTKDATQRLQEGQLVTVDGNKGWVLAAEE